MSPFDKAVVAGGKSVAAGRKAQALIRANAPSAVTLSDMLLAPRSPYFRLRLAIAQWRLSVAEARAARAWRRLTLRKYEI